MIQELIPYASLALIIFIVLTCLALLLFHVVYQRCLLRSSCSRSLGLDFSTLKKLPVFRYSDMKGVGIRNSEQQLECAVCLSAFEGHEMLRLLPRCGHAFHTQCVDPWLANHTTCPYCRGNLLTRTGEVRHVFMVMSDELGGDGSDAASTDSVSVAVDEIIHLQDYQQHQDSLWRERSLRVDREGSLGSLLENPIGEKGGAVVDNKMAVSRSSDAAV
ncbi:hypothetical protein Droror1_Dr00024857 [Drosera rotundifolia]